MRKNVVHGIIGVVFGALWTTRGLLSGTAANAADSPYAAGQLAATVFGVVFLAAGLYYLRKGLKESR